MNKEDARLAEFQRDYAEQLEAKDAELDRACRLLLDVEGTIIAYWTDIPEALLERHRVEIRAFLGDWEPESEVAAAQPARIMQTTIRREPTVTTEPTTTEQGDEQPETTEEPNPDQTELEPDKPSTDDDDDAGQENT